MLAESDAVILYQLKFNASARNCSSRGKSGPISKVFGISARAVRDIWNRKTWAYTTSHLWAREDSMVLSCGQNKPRAEVFHNKYERAFSLLIITNGPSIANIHRG